MASHSAILWVSTILYCTTTAIADIRCYSCTSYMTQCKNTVDDSQGDIFKENCNSKCFVRMGEDGALYRGCFDGFMEVSELKYTFNGCKNQTWNRKSLQWCMCDSDLCNTDLMGMQTDNYYDDNDYGKFQKYDYNDIDYDVKKDKYDNNENVKTVKYDYSDVKNDNYNYDDTTYNVKGSKYDYNDVSYDTNDLKYDAINDDASSYMERYAREGPLDSSYDESLFGRNEPSYQQNAYKEIKYMSPDTPSYPPQYDVGYRRYDSPGGYDKASKLQYYRSPDYPQETYYPHTPQYARETGPAYNYNTQKPYDDPVQKPSSNYVSARLATKIRCRKSGYYQNPNDCRQFVACLMDPYSKTPVMHVMKCPEGLVWDNKKKICMEYSTTCNVVISNFIDDELNQQATKIDVTGYNSNNLEKEYDEKHDDDGRHDNTAADDTQQTDYNSSQDVHQDNTYGISGDVNRELYSDSTYNANAIETKDDEYAKDVVF